ncbi:MAG: hypothetical protein IT376_08400 [Polyangiaceae bacterium]|nr:hypothetical protein [Polyangiaceae bacterium]
MSRWRALMVIGVWALGCSSDDSPGARGGGADAGADAGLAGESIWVGAAELSTLSEASFFDHPWPSDLRRDAAGKVDFAGYPNPRAQPLIRDFLDSLNGTLDGFSPAAAGYVRFSVPLDPGSIPTDPIAALEPDSSVQLIDIDPASPERGARRRISLFLRRDAGVYWPAGTLAFLPTFGFPLRPNTRYAFVVTDAIRAEGGGRIGRASALDAALHETSGVVADAAAELTAAGVDVASVVHLAPFTTNDPTAEARALRDWVRDEYPAPTADAARWAARDAVAGRMDVYEGEYGPSPDFQRGSIPFTSYGDGGELAFDATGKPQLQREFQLRFSLAVPDATLCPMPAAGYPIVLYAHGTGGNYRSMLGADDEAESLAARCIATMGIDQIFHGTRPGGECGEAPPPCNTNVELIFFNVQNPTAARANGPQSAIDVVQQARLFTESGMTVPPSVSRTGSEIRFDGSRVMFFGHSQGGLNGPLFLAIDDAARGAVLSGSGSLISITLLEKTKPVNVAGLVKTLLGVVNLEEQELEDINSFHPAISLAQSIVDTTDPIHYVPWILRAPRPGFVPKSVLMTEGIDPDGSGDNYTPPHAIEVQAVALGLPPQTPLIHPIVELAWSDLAPVTVPAGGLAGNLAGGLASGVLAQWPASEASDGHFVIYDIPRAMDQCSGFLRELADDPRGRVPAP